MSDTKHFLEALNAKLGEEMGLTDWYCYDQAAVSTHGANSGDDGPIHSDADYCRANTPFGGTIVTGSLLRSRVTSVASARVWPPGGMGFRLSDGFNRRRVIQPVKAGQSVRTRFQGKQAGAKDDQAALVSLDVSFEAEGTPGTVLAAEWLAYLRFSS